jgi:hypothetical protein
LPELPLERTLSRKSVLCQVKPLISGNETRLDLSTPDPGAPIDGLAIDDQALFIIQQLASLLTRRALCLPRVPFPPRCPVADHPFARKAASGVRFGSAGDVIP